MNGATADPCVNITSRPSRASITTMGPSHHFLRTRMKAHSSPMMPSFSRDSSNAIAFPFNAEDAEMNGEVAENAQNQDTSASSLFSLCDLCVEEPSVQLEQRAPIDVLAQGRLVLLVEQVMAEHEVVHVRAHEAQVGVVGGADDRLAPHVDRRIDDDGHAGQPLELADDVVVERT